MGEFDFINGISLFINTAKDSNSTDVVCNSSIDHYKFYQFALIPAVVLTLLMAATKTRRQKLLSVLHGRPGLIFPMDTMTRSSRLAYCCAFGATAFLVYQILLQGQFAVEYTGTMALSTFIAVASMFIYGMVFMPVFTCLALETAFSYFVGSLYVWMFFVVQIYKGTECNFNAEGRTIIIMRALPSLLCLAYLSISMPIKCGVAIYHKKYFTPSLGEDPYSETIEEIKESYQGKHVRHLLRKPDIARPPEGVVNIVKASVIGIVGDWIYHNHSGFRYPTRLLSVMFVSGCVVYMITVQVLGTIVAVLNNVLDGLQQTIEFSSDHEDSFGVSFLKSTTTAVYVVTEIIKVSLIVSMTLSSVITLLNILHMISSFRTNLFALYRGDYSHIPPPQRKGAISLCTSNIKYAGYQVGYIVWAYILSAVVLFIICIVLAIIIILLVAGYTDWLLDYVLQLWPGLVIGLGVYIVQWLLAKFVFLQNKGQHVQLDNRRFYFVFVYFMFFYNIFLGLISCLLRILKAIGVGTVFLARLDNSTLPRKFEFFDPGFNAYQGYIHIEAAHTNPVVNVFLRLLVALSKSRKKEQSGDKEIEISHQPLSFENGNYKMQSKTEPLTARPINVGARFNWFVTYTLLQNPMVRIYRKGFMQSLQKARKEGLKVPISDNPITDFDLVKAHADRDKQRAEEAKQMRSTGHELSRGLATIAVNMSGEIEDGNNNKQNGVWPGRDVGDHDPPVLSAVL